MKKRAVPAGAALSRHRRSTAGDGYLAGVCVALSGGKDLPQAAALASAVASLVVTRRGAQTSIPDREEARALLQQLDP